MSLVLLGGKERTLTEFTHLLAAAGYRIDQIIPTPTEFSHPRSGPHRRPHSRSVMNATHNRLATAARRLRRLSA